MQKHDQGAEKSIPGSGLTKYIVKFGVGIITGTVRLGGCTFVPSFIYILAAPVKLTVGTSPPSYISVAVVSGGFKLYKGYVDIIAALCLGVGTAVGA